MGSTSNVHTAYVFIFQNSSCCWKGFLLPCSSTRLCKTPSPTQLFSSICNESLGKPLKNYTIDLPTPRGRWMRYSGLPPHLNANDSTEKQPRGWRLQSLHPPVPRPPGTPLQPLPARGSRCHRNGSLPYITYLPGKRRGRPGLLSNRPSQLRSDKEENLPSNC